MNCFWTAPVCVGAVPAISRKHFPLGRSSFELSQQSSRRYLRLPTWVGSSLVQLSPLLDLSPRATLSPLARLRFEVPFPQFQIDSIITRSSQRADQVQDHHDQQDRPDDSQASACPPPGIPEIAAASTEQQQQNNN